MKHREEISFYDQLQFLGIGGVTAILVGFLVAWPIGWIIYAMRFTMHPPGGEDIFPIMFLVGIPTGIGGIASWAKKLSFIKTWILTAVLVGFPYTFIVLRYLAIALFSNDVPYDQKGMQILRAFVMFLLTVFMSISVAASASGMHLFIRKLVLSLFPEIKNSYSTNDIP